MGLRATGRSGFAVRAFGDLAEQGLDLGDGGVAWAVQPGQVSAKLLQGLCCGVAFASAELQERQLPVYFDGAWIVRAKGPAHVVEQVAQLPQRQPYLPDQGVARRVLHPALQHAFVLGAVPGSEVGGEPLVLRSGRAVVTTLEPKVGQVEPQAEHLSIGVAERLARPFHRLSQQLNRLAEPGLTRECRRLLSDAAKLAP